jgi:hypothetical protein
MNRRLLSLLAVLTLLPQAGLHAQTNKRIPDLVEILGAAVDPANDLLWINDTSAGNNTNASKKISIAELANVSSFTNGNFLAVNSVEIAQVNTLATALAGKQTADAQLDTWATVTPGTGVAAALENATGTSGGVMLHNGSVAGATVDAGGFDGILATTDNTMQEIAQKLDDMAGGSGDVVGPGVSVNNYLPVFSGTTGKLIADSGVALTAVALKAGGFTQFTAGSASSADLRGVLTDENGTGTILTSNGALTTNTGLPISTGVSGLGTGIAAALAVNTGSAGAPVLLNGAGGTPTSIALTNASGLPVASGISGLGTGIAAALAVNTGSAGAPVLLNGALGTPSSGTISGSFVTGGTFGAVNGSALTALNGTNIGSGVVAASRGGTGVSNTGTITLAGNLVTTGAFNTTFGQTATTVVTLPSTNSTMARTDAAQTFTGIQTLASAPVLASLSGIVYSNTGSGTSAITSSTVGQTLRVTGANTYAFGALDLADADAVTGIIPPANLGTGSSIATKFLQGDGTWQTVVGGSVATDTIWNAAGDLAMGTGSDTASRVALGTAGQLLQVNAGATGFEWTSSPTVTTFGATTANVGTLSFEGATVDTFQLLFAVEDPAGSDKTVTFRNATGTVVISGDTFTGDVTGTLDTDGTTALTIQANAVAVGTDISGLGSNVATALATPSSANLRAAITDEVGTGAAVFVGGETDTLIVAASDETTAITTGVAKITFRAPYAMTITAVKASLTTDSSSGNPTFDINESGATILSTKITIDATEKTSTTFSGSAAVISDSAIAADAEITIDIDTAGTGATGAKVYLTHQH